jgi:ribosomal protein L40E
MKNEFESVYNKIDYLDVSIKKLEQEVNLIKWDQNISVWVDTIEQDKFIDRYPNNAWRIIAINHEFQNKKPNYWTPNNLRLYKKALAKSGIDIDKPVSLSRFIEELIFGLPEKDLKSYDYLLYFDRLKNPLEIIEEISAKILTATVKTSHRSSQQDNDLEIINKKYNLFDRLNISKKALLADIALGNLELEGYDLNAEIPYSDFAIEFLHSTKLVRELMIACPRCGDYENSPEAQFCRKCGTKLERKSYADQKKCL